MEMTPAKANTMCTRHDTLSQFPPSKASWACLEGEYPNCHHHATQRYVTDIREDHRHAEMPTCHL
jgi:hypothetical protein